MPTTSDSPNNFLQLATMKNFYLFVLVLCVHGCTNNNIITVNGTLTQNGKPLTDVRIEFCKIDTGSLSFAETDEHGRFKLIHTHGQSGVEPGKYHVSIFQKSKPIPLPAGKGQEDVPEEYRNRTTPEIPLSMSDNKPIEIDIPGKGNNNIIIDLK
jgi:hypothetical protein